MADAAKPPRSLISKLLIGAGIALPILLVGAYFAIPPIASSIAPGKIEAAAGEAIKGKVKVSDVSVSWSGPIKVGKIELLDEQGKTVGVLAVSSTLGIWKAIGGLSDLGTTNISGKIDLVRQVDAKGNVTSNLQRAIEARTPSAGSSGGAKIPPIAAALRIDGLDVTFKELDAQGATTAEARMTGLKGDASVRTLAGAEPSAAADLSAKFSTSGGADGGLSVKMKAAKFVDAAGVIKLDGAAIDAEVAATGVPTGLVDALTGQQGLLSGALGDRADARVLAKGNSVAGSGSLVLTAPNATADLSLSVANGRLQADKPGSIEFKSTAFVLRQPAVRETLEKSGISITDAPSFQARVRALSWPLSGADLRSAAVDIEAQLSEIRGTAKVGEQQLKRLVMSPAKLAVKTVDLAKQIEAKVQSSATLDGQSAGEILVDLVGAKLLDAQGKMAPPASVELSGSAELRGLSATLLQPLAVGAGLPLSLAEDIGPMVDVTLRPRQSPGSASRTVEVSVQAANLQASAAVAIDDKSVSSDSLNVSVPRAMPLVRRFAGPDSAVKLSGEAPTTLRGSFNLPLAGGKVSFDGAAVDVSAQLGAFSTQFGAEQPVAVSRAVLAGSAKPGQALRVTLDADASQGGQSAKLAADVQAPGLLGNAAPTKLPALGGARLKGFVRASQVSGPMVESLGRACGVFTDLNKAGPLVRDILGASTNAELALTPAADGNQTVMFTVQGANLNIQAGATATPQQLRAEILNGSLAVSPALADALLTWGGQPAQGRTAHLTGPATVQVTMTNSFAVPWFKDATGATTAAPDLAKAGDAAAAIQFGVDRIAVVGLVPEQPAEVYGAKDLAVNATVPLAVLDDRSTSPTPLNATVNAALVQGDASVGSLTGTVKSSASRSVLDADLTLANVPTRVLDGFAGRSGSISGFTGDKATFKMTARRAAAGQPIDVATSVQSPLLQLNDVRLDLGETAIRLKSPATARVSAQPDYVNTHLLAVPPGDETALRLAAPATVDLEFRTFVLSTSQTVNGQTVGGVLKPGVFAMDVTARMPKVEFMRQERSAAGAAARVSTVLNDAQVKLATRPDGALAVDIVSASVVEGSLDTKAPVAVSWAARNYADQYGAAQFGSATHDVRLNAPHVPTALIEVASGRRFNLVQTLGPDMAADITLTNFSKQTGAIDAKLRSNKASMVLVADVRDGTMIVRQGTPFTAQLSEFSYGVDTKVLQIFPLFAQASKAADGTFSGISSSNLRFPIDGDMRKFNGTIRVDIGKINYVFNDGLGPFLDATIFRGGQGTEQRPIQPFDVTIVNGVVTYDKFEIPIRNFGFKTKGSVDLVGENIDVVTYIPTIASAQGLVGNINKRLGSGFGRVLPDILSEGTMIPIRTKGPMKSPTRDVDVTLMVEELGNQLNPINILGKIPDLFAPKDKPKTDPGTAPKNQPQTTPPSNQPSTSPPPKKP